MKNGRGVVRKAGKRGLHGGLPTGAAFPQNVMAARRHRAARAALAVRAKAEGKTVEQLAAELREQEGGTARG
jgi:hypothetical protein